MTSNQPDLTPDTSRPLRADARRNRAKVLEAADRVFPSEGRATTTEAVARAATDADLDRTASATVGDGLRPGTHPTS